MKKQPLAYQRKRPRYAKKIHVGIPKPGEAAQPASGAASEEEYEEGEEGEEGDDEEGGAAEHSAEAEAAYEILAGQENGEQPTSERRPPPFPQAQSGAPAAEDNSPEAVRQRQIEQQRVLAEQRREQDRVRREADRERREVERREQQRRENERREQQRREIERRERERELERRQIDIDSLCVKAWAIFSAEVAEEGVELFPDNEGRELAKRSFRLAELFLVEECRLRKARNEPLPPEPPAGTTTDGQPQSSGEPAASSTEEPAPQS